MVTSIDNTLDQEQRPEPAKHPKRRLRRLEKRLTAVREVEAKRTRQAERAREQDGAETLIAKRARQLEKAARRGAALETVIAGLRTAVPSNSGKGKRTAARSAVRHAFCLRERMSVEMQDPKPFVMRNGRAATVGTCPSCGARVIRPGS